MAIQRAAAPVFGGRNQQAAAPAEDRPVSQTWANFGIVLNVRNSETGETEEKFISAPTGVPLDFAKPMVARGSNDDWHQEVQVKNQILTYLQDLAEGLAPGESVITELRVEVRRANAKAEAPDEASNSLLADAMSILKR